MRSSNPVLTRRGFSRGGGYAGFESAGAPVGSAYGGGNPYAQGPRSTYGGSQPYSAEDYAEQAARQAQAVPGGSIFSTGVSHQASEPFSAISVATASMVASLIVYSPQRVQSLIFSIESFQPIHWLTGARRINSDARAALFI